MDYLRGLEHISEAFAQVGLTAEFPLKIMKLGPEKVRIIYQSQVVLET